MNEDCEHEFETDSGPCKKCHRTVTELLKRTGDESNQIGYYELWLTREEFDRAILLKMFSSHRVIAQNEVALKVRAHIEDSIILEVKTSRSYTPRLEVLGVRRLK